MVTLQPHFLLFSGVESQRTESARWHFLLESTDGSTVLEASDVEPDYQGERLELLAVIRGLEALDQPSRVTLITSNRHISRGFRFGLDEWRTNRWCWERDGRREPVKNFDLWRRIDRALRFHEVRCRTWRIDPAHAGPGQPSSRRRRDQVAKPIRSEAEPVSLWSQIRHRMAHVSSPLRWRSPA